MLNVFDRMNTVQTQTVMESPVEMLLTNSCCINIWKDEYSADPNSHGKSCESVGDKQMLNKSLKRWI